MPATLSEIRAYYDKNTPLFLRFSSAPETQTIHRSLWFKDTRRLKDALAVSNNLILEEAQDLQILNPRIADLGCGAGATLFHVLAGLGAGRGVGVTLSAVQARIAESARGSLGMSNVSFLQGDFQHIPIQGNFDLIYSIEAFVHAQSPLKYLQEVSRLLAPKGRLILLDDFYMPARVKDDYAQRWIKAYNDGWYVPALQTAEEVTASARDLGLTLIRSHELTPNLRLRALPDLLAHAILWLGNILPHDHPIVPSMLGSMALQQCLKAGWIEYRMMVFEKN
jgi:cyclopropane fatty-acyl-phospholipid synthase-like methyltransferase